jgi:16S rRNA (guanine966-N2)-methyltransferase
VPGQSTRPITDRVKEALFDILGGRVVEARFLDLFAGTGAVGIEALSRGAGEATFVERNARALATLRRNLQHTRLGEGAVVVRGDVFAFVASYQGQPFDIAYVAPPQYKGLWAQTVQALDDSPILGADSLVIAQIYPKEYQALQLTRLWLSDQRKYGSTMLCFYELGAGEANPAVEPGAPG